MSVPKVTLTLIGLLLIDRRNHITNFLHCFYTLACYQIMRIKKIINLGFNYCLDLTPYSQDCSKENYIYNQLFGEFSFQRLGVKGLTTQPRSRSPQ